MELKNTTNLKYRRDQQQIQMDRRKKLVNLKSGHLKLLKKHGIPKVENRVKEKENLTEETMTKIFPNLKIDMDIQIKEVQ
jgi:hypothetical protein